jgi:hypothetical protein
MRCQDLRYLGTLDVLAAQDEQVYGVAEMIYDVGDYFAGLGWRISTHTA